MAKENEKTNQAFLIYQDDNGITQVNVRFEGEDVWLPVELIMELFDASQQDVSYHIGQIYASGELNKDRTHKKFLLVRQEGDRSVSRQISHYNLDIIIAVGFRVQSQVAIRFRQWATEHLHEFIVKGFTLDDNRLKGNRSRYFRELLQRIRDIRSSERNLTQGTARKQTRPTAMVEIMLFFFVSLLIQSMRAMTPKPIQMAKA